MIRSRALWCWLSGLSAVIVASCSSSPGTGGLRQACFANGTCNQGLVCLSKVCVATPDAGAGAGGAGTTGASGISGSGGAAGAAAGASGGDASAGTSGGDAAAGTSGGDAAAGTSGGDAAAGTSGGDAAVDSHVEAGAETIVNCGIDRAWGPFAFSDPTDSAIESMSSGHYEVDWEGFLGDASSPNIADILQVAVITGRMPFGTTLATMPSIDLSTQSDLQTCGACVLMVLNADTTNPRNVEEVQLGPDYVATSGTLDLTQVPALPATTSSRYSGTLSNVVFEHMNVDPATFATTPVGDGCKFTVSTATFDVPVTNL